MKITPLDKWVNEKTGGSLPGYWLERINETLKTARRGAYYNKTLPEKIGSLAEFPALPAIDAATLTERGSGLVCVPPDEISRIVTLKTSGTTGRPKRVYFTQEDQELTVDFFANGLPTVCDPGDTMAVLLPCERPGGVGDLIARALTRIPVTPVLCGPVTDPAGCAATLGDAGATAVVGTPVQTLDLARYCETAGVELGIRSVLLSTDNIPRVIVSELQRIWGCGVYEHYGMTEMGLGGAIDCDAHSGYHIRENDLYIEILDKDGEPAPDGQAGELAFTTLTRAGMPFVRYKTGDITSILPGRCACGSDLRRIAPISGRAGGDIVFRNGITIRMPELDEILFAFFDTRDFTVTAMPGANRIEVNISVRSGSLTAEAALAALGVHGLLEGADIRITVRRTDAAVSAGKRLITVRD